MTMPWCMLSPSLLSLSLSLSTPTILLTFPPEINSHLRYTIPPAIALTYGYRPLCTVLDVYKILFLIAVCIDRAHTMLIATLILFWGKIDRSRLYYAVGLVSNTHPNMDLSIHCHHWPHTLSHSGRGNLLLCYSNI